MKNIAISITDQESELSSNSSPSKNEEPKISINQINVLVTSKQYKIIAKSLKKISKIINSD